MCSTNIYKREGGWRDPKLTEKHLLFYSVYELAIFMHEKEYRGSWKYQISNGLQKVKYGVGIFVEATLTHWRKRKFELVHFPNAQEKVPFIV